MSSRPTVDGEYDPVAAAANRAAASRRAAQMQEADRLRREAEAKKAAERAAAQRAAAAQRVQEQAVKKAQEQVAQKAAAQNAAAQKTAQKAAQKNLDMLSTAYSQGHKQQIQSLLTQVSNKQITSAQFERSKKALEREYQSAWKRIKNNTLNSNESKWIRDENYKAVLARMKAVTDRALVVSGAAKVYAADVKAYTEKVVEYTQAVKEQTAKSPTWTVKDPRTGKVSTFTDRSKAKTFSTNLAKSIVRDETQRRQELGSLTATKREQHIAQAALAKMVSGGLAKESKTDGKTTFKFTGSLKEMSLADMKLARAAGFDIPVDVKIKSGRSKTIFDTIADAVGGVGSAYESIFKSVTDPIYKTAERSAEKSITSSMKGRPIEGFTAYAVGTTLRAAGGAIDIVTFPVRPESWAKTAEAVGLLLMPTKAESYSEYRSRISDMVKGDIADKQMREEIERTLLKTMPHTPLSSENIKAGKEFREAVVSSIMADPVGFLAEVAGGLVGAKLLSSTLSRLTTGRTTIQKMSNVEYLEYLEKHPWSGGMAASQESTWWLDQVVDDLVKRVKPDGSISYPSAGNRWKSSSEALRDALRKAAQSTASGGTGFVNIRTGLPSIDINPWTLALATPGAYNAIRDELRAKGLTDAQIDRLLIDVTRAEEMNLSGVGPTVVYESPQAVAAFSGTKPSMKAIGDIRVDADVKPLEIQIPDITLEQGVVPEITPVQPVPTEPDKPTTPPKPEPPKEPEEPTKPGDPPKPPMPLKPKGKDGRMRPNVFRALVGGLKEKYRVVFDYPKGKAESFAVTARSFPQALSQATQLRRVKYVPSEVDVAKVGK